MQATHFSRCKISILKDNFEGSKISLFEYVVVLNNNSNKLTNTYTISETESTVTFIFTDETVYTIIVIFQRPTKIKENEPGSHFTGFKCADDVMNVWLETYPIKTCMFTLFY